MKTRWRPFLFGDMDYRAARLWLEEQGAQGWRLDKVFGRLELVRFVEADAPVHYDAVLRRGGAGREDYLALCADAGWRLGATVSGIDVFVSAPGEAPVPIETDPALEGRRVVRQNLLSALIFLAGAAVLLLAMGWYFWWGGRLGGNGLYYLSSNALLVYVLWQLLFLADSVWMFPAALIYGLRCRRAARAGREPPTTSRFWARVRSFLCTLLPRAMGVLVCLSCVIALIAYGFSPEANRDAGPVYTARREEYRAAPVVMAEDVGLPAGSVRGGGHTHSASLLLTLDAHYELGEVGEGGLYELISDRYQARWPWLARLTEALVLRQEQGGGSRHILHQELEYTQAELGFDSAWVAREGGMTYLILRRGNTVASVEAPADLTDPDTLAAVAGRLGI